MFGLEKRQLRLSAERRPLQDGSWSFLLRRNGLKLCPGMFRLGIRKNFLIVKVVKHWNKHWLPREAVESQSLDPMSLGTWFSGEIDGVRLMFGLDYFPSIFHP